MNLSLLSVPMQGTPGEQLMVMAKTSSCIFPSILDKAKMQIGMIKILKEQRFCKFDTSKVFHLQSVRSLISTSNLVLSPGHYSL
jgi:hypothetical protein